MAQILVVDDERLIRAAIRQHLEGLGHTVLEAGTVKDTYASMDAVPADVVILDYRLPDGTGMEVLREITQRWPDSPVVMMTAFSTIEGAVEAMRLGAFTYVNKPFDIAELAVTVDKAVENHRLKRKVKSLVDRERKEHGFGQLVASSPSMRRVIDLARKMAQSPTATVLLLGESGTGKDLLARAIHAESPNAEGPFMNVTCSALQETLIESELFGHEKGAFTDAKAQKKGLVELAQGGTVYLDEIGELPASVQAKLLRFLEEKSFKRVGGTRDVEVVVRVVAATNRDLYEMVRNGTFREDLFYRLMVLPLHLPPLKDRTEDIDELVHHFVQRFGRESGARDLSVEPDAMRALRNHTWPGNIRELRNTVERALILGDGSTIRANDLWPTGRESNASPSGTGVFHLPSEGIEFATLEKEVIRQALERTSGNQVQAAKLIGLTRDQLRYRMEKFGITAEGLMAQVESEK